MMTRSRTLAALVLGLTLLGTACAAAFGPDTTSAGFGAVFLAYAAVGWVVVRHQPSNRVGWLLMAFGATGSLMGLLAGYAALARVTGLGGEHVATWAESWLWAPTLGVVTGPLLVLFPDGRAPSPRWHFVFWTSAAFIVCASLGNALYPFPPGDGGPNPYGIAGAEGPLTVLLNFSGVCLLASLAGGIGALVVRFRRGGHVQRQQLKWFLAAAVLVPVTILIGDMNNQSLQDIAVPIGMSLLAVATGIAILRHGLYDIDRIISRTVGWALVSIVIGAVYLGGVTLLTAASSRLTGESTVAVAASTLLAAAAFGPVRRRIQSAVDRRFNRARYDAAHTVDIYRMHLRDELDVVSISSHLQGAVVSTLQPTTLSLWLRAPEART